MIKLVFLLAAVLLATTAKADRYYWVSSTQKIEVKSEGVNKQYPFDLERIHEYTKVDIVMEDNWVTEYQESVRQCENYTCFGAQRETPLWDNYLAESDNLKPRRLALAIEGLSESSAAKLIRNNYFKYEPQSWFDFKQDITEAREMKLLSAGEVSKILYDNARINLKNMGYLASECSVDTYSCSTFKEIRVNRPIPVQKEVTVKNVIEQKTVNVSVIAENVPLLPHEVEIFKITLQPENNSIQAEQVTSYAEYQLQVSMDRNEVRIIPQQRKKIDINSRLVTRMQLKEEVAQAVLYVEVNPELLVTDDVNDKLVLTYQVKHCVPGWTGLCGMFEKWKLLTPVSIPIEQNTNRVVLDMSALPAKVRMELEYSFQRPNSRWYNSKPTRSDTTNTINVKR